MNINYKYLLIELTFDYIKVNPARKTVISNIRENILLSRLLAYYLLRNFKYLVKRLKLLHVVQKDELFINLILLCGVILIKLIFKCKVTQFPSIILQFDTCNIKRDLHKISEYHTWQLQF